MITLSILAVAAFLTPQEQSLNDQLPTIFAKAAEHYRAIDAATTPIYQLDKPVKSHGVDETCDTVVHGWNRKTKQYDMRPIYWWTAGHFPGSLWYLYEATGEDFFRQRAEFWTSHNAPNSKVSSNHDVGFIMYCSYGNWLRLTEDPAAKQQCRELLIETAHSLTNRYHEGLGLIRSWGNIGSEKDFLVIPDNMMNLELLLWAAKNSGDRTLAEKAMSHADVTMKNHYREDGGCYHVLDYDQRPGFVGSVKGISRGQGLSCLTAWSRGQSWSIYGYTMMYRLTGRDRYLAFARKLADYAMNHPNMPEDGIPYWDYGAPGEERDTSAASCMASALLELSRYLGVADARRYRAFAVKQLLSLSSSEYFSQGDEIGHFLLKHGTGHKPAGSEIDTPLDYGDYYYLEALLRFRQLVQEEQRLASIAELLPPKAELPLEVIGWYIEALSDSTNSAATIAAAERMLSEPFPELPDELYLKFWKTGNRVDYQRPNTRRLQMISTLAAAEFFERKGRFLPLLEEMLTAICNQKSWTLPAHDWSDGGRGTFNKTYTAVDLMATRVGMELGWVVQLLGDRLPAELVERIKFETECRVFAPVRRELRYHRRLGGDPSLCYDCVHWWMDCRNNWNSVCWDGVVTAAEALVDDPLDRARFIAAAETAIDPYLEGGFDPDGYCNEGMGYWIYGFGHHLKMGLMLRRITDGRLDVFTRPRQRLAAKYAHESLPAPLFSDVVPSREVVFGTPHLLALTEEIWPDLKRQPGPISEFPDAQVWIGRGAGATIAVKGGNNGDNHNHNDIGSYSIYLGDRYAAGDCGSEVYTRNTFNSKRFESKVNNSYGHPVPIVGGRLQSLGADFRGEVLVRRFEAGVGELTLELKGAYECSSLKSLRRTFRFDSAAKKFIVNDRVEFSEPTSYEEAFLSYRQQDNVAESDLCELVYDFRPQISVKGGEYSISEETIANPHRFSPFRTGIRFREPITQAEVEFVYTLP